MEIVEDKDEGGFVVLEVCIDYLLSIPAADHPHDQIHRPLNPVTRAVDAEIIIPRLPPVASGIILIIFNMRLIKLRQESLRLLLILHAAHLHNPMNPLLKRRRDEDADMRDPVIGKNRVCAPPHHHEILSLRHITQQVALVEEYRILLRKPVVSVELP